MAASRSDSRREQNSEATDAEFLKGYIRLFSHFPNPGVGRLDKITSFLLLTNLIFNCLPDDGTTHEKVCKQIVIGLSLIFVVDFHRSRRCV